MEVALNVLNLREELLREMYTYLLVKDIIEEGTGVFEVRLLPFVCNEIGVPYGLLASLGVYGSFDAYLSIYIDI